MNYGGRFVRSTALVGVALLLMACAASGASGGDSAGPLWQIEIVVSDEAEFGENGIEFGSAGAPHLIYKRDSDDQLVYLTRSGSGWSNHDTGRITIDNDFFLSSNDEPNLITVEFDSSLTNLEIYHVSSSDDTNWIEGHILTDSSVYAAAGAIDSNDTVHVAYNYASYDLGYAAGTGAVWNDGDLDTSISDIDIDVAITVDESDTVYLVYLDYGESLYTLKLISSPASGSETVHEIDTSGGAEPAYSVVADDGGRIHVAYGWFNGGDTELRYAVFNGLSWTTETVATGMALEDSPPMAIDSAGVVHIAYTGDSDRQLYYARKGNGWTSGPVPIGTNQVANPDLALDGQERPVIVYNDRNSGELGLSSRTR